MPQNDIKKYLASDSNLFLHLDDPKWLKQLNKGVGQIIKYTRQSNKLSFAQCSKKTGIPVEQLKRYEKGEEQVNIFHLWNLCEIEEPMWEFLYGLTPYFLNLKDDD